MRPVKIALATHGLGPVLFRTQNGKLTDIQYMPNIKQEKFKRPAKTILTSYIECFNDLSPVTETNIEMRPHFACGQPMPNRLNHGLQHIVKYIPH